MMITSAEPVHAGDRAIRQRDLVPPAALAQYEALVIGVGAVGRQVALQLAAMGVPKMTLIDDDHVAIENLAVQGYRHADLGQPKVDATAALALQLNPELQVEAVHERFRRSSAESLACLRASGASTSAKLAVFACVDSMSSRRIVWEATRSRASFFADARMAGEVLRAVVAGEPSTDGYYATTLFEDASAYPAPCTGRSTLYAASILAGLLLSRFAMHLRGLHPPCDTLLNLLAGEMTTDEQHVVRPSSIHL